MNSSARDSGSALCCISSRQKLGFTRPCRGRKRSTFRNNLRIFVLPAGFAPDLYLAGDERRLRWCGLQTKLLRVSPPRPGRDLRAGGAFAQPLLPEMELREDARRVRVDHR